MHLSTIHVHQWLNMFGSVSLMLRYVVPPHEMILLLRNADFPSLRKRYVVLVRFVVPREARWDSKKYERSGFGCPSKCIRKFHTQIPVVHA